MKVSSNHVRERVFSVEEDYTPYDIAMKYKQEIVMCGSAFVVFFSAVLQGGEVLLGEACEFFK